MQVGLWKIADNEVGLDAVVDINIVWIYVCAVVNVNFNSSAIVEAKYSISRKLLMTAVV